MGKFIFWIVIFFLVLFGLRIASILSSRRKDDDRLDASASSRQKLPEGEPTVRCASCGAFIPKKQAVLRLTGYRCGQDYDCQQRDA